MAGPYRATQNRAGMETTLANLAAAAETTESNTLTSPHRPRDQPTISLVWSTGAMLV